MTTHQLSLFDRPHREVRPADPNLTPVERKRLGPKCKLILRRLREGPATTADLAALYYKFTQRIYDLRNAGCDVGRVELGPGMHLYTLKHEPEGLV